MSTISVFWTPGSEPKPWFIHDPIQMPEKQNTIKLDPNWKPIEDNNSKLHVMTKEECDEFDRKQQLKMAINRYNADFLSDLPENEQWAFLDTMQSMQNSMVRLSNTVWSEDHRICGAVYGQNLAKIEQAGKILGGKYVDKLKDALDWFTDHTIGEQKVYPINKGDTQYQKFSQVFEKLGHCTNARQFKKSLQSSLEHLTTSVGKKYSSVGQFARKNNFNTNQDKEIEQGMFWDEWSIRNIDKYSVLFMDDWDDYHSLLISHKTGITNLSSFLYKTDIIA